MARRVTRFLRSHHHRERDGGGHGSEKVSLEDVEFEFLEDGGESFAATSISRDEIWDSNELELNEDDDEDDGKKGIELTKSFWENQHQLLQSHPSLLVLVLLLSRLELAVAAGFLPPSLGHWVAGLWLELAIAGLRLLPPSLVNATLCRSSSVESRIRNTTKEALKETQSLDATCGCPNSISVCKKCLLRRVSSRLQSNGHNSAICKTKWRNPPTHIPSGEHNFVDVGGRQHKLKETRGD